MEQNQEQTGNAMAFETIANMLADIKGTTDFTAERLENAQPATISPETEQKLAALAGQLAGLKPPTHFTEEQRNWLASALRATENNIAAVINRAAIPSSVLKDIQDSLKRIDGFIANPKTILCHEYAIDFKNHRAVATIIIMGLIILLLGAGNIWQFSDNCQYRDNDLKYRYIRMYGGVGTSDLYSIERWFNDPDSTYMVKFIRRKVNAYEENIRKQVAIPAQPQPEAEVRQNKK